MTRVISGDLLLDAETSLLAAIDFQEKLTPTISGAASVVVSARTLLQGARLFQIPIVATEQYPQGLGETIEPIRSCFPESLRPIPKTAFSCCLEESFRDVLDRNEQARQIVLTGFETHICLLQTAFDLLNRGKQVFVPIDAVASAGRDDHLAAIRRLENNGVIITTTESVLFEWLRTSRREQFRSMSRLVRERRKELDGFAEQKTV